MINDLGFLKETAQLINRQIKKYEKLSVCSSLSAFLFAVILILWWHIISFTFFLLSLIAYFYIHFKRVEYMYQKLNYGIFLCEQYKAYSDVLIATIQNSEQKDESKIMERIEELSKELLDITMLCD